MNSIGLLILNIIKSTIVPPINLVLKKSLVFLYKFGKYVNVNPISGRTLRRLPPV